MVRACGSYPQCPGFNSLHRHHFPVMAFIRELNGSGAPTSKLPIDFLLPFRARHSFLCLGEESVSVILPLDEVGDGSMTPSRWFDSPERAGRGYQYRHPLQFFPESCFIISSSVTCSALLTQRRASTRCIISASTSFSVLRADALLFLSSYPSSGQNLQEGLTL